MSSPQGVAAVSDTVSITMDLPAGSAIVHDVTAPPPKELVQCPVNGIAGAASRTAPSTVRAPAPSTTLRPPLTTRAQFDVVAPVVPTSQAATPSLFFVMRASPPAVVLARSLRFTLLPDVAQTPVGIVTPTTIMPARIAISLPVVISYTRFAIPPPPGRPGYRGRIR